MFTIFPKLQKESKKMSTTDNTETTSSEEPVLCQVIPSVKSASQLVDMAAPAGIPSIDEEYFNRPGIWDEKDLKSLYQKNRDWASQQETLKPGFFSELSKGHAPKILWIGCSDARVPANEMIGEPPGSVFVHRNVANLVISTDVNCHSVLQYAVDVLKVKHIIVCGHYQCGGVRASLEPIDHGAPLENWLRNIRDTYRLHKTELNAIYDPIHRQRRLVELNVQEQVKSNSVSTVSLLCVLQYQTNNRFCYGVCFSVLKPVQDGSGAEEPHRNTRPDRPARVSSMKENSFLVLQRIPVVYIILILTSFIHAAPRSPSPSPRSTAWCTSPLLERPTSSS